MIALTRLVEMHGRELPDPSLAQWILQNRIVTVSDWLYHGSPLEGLRDILRNGIHGTQHGEVAEYDSFSTSFNSEVLDYFSELEGTTGLQFKVEHANVVVLDDMLGYLVTQLPGSGLSLEVDDEAEFAAFVSKFKIPSERGRPYLPYDYLSSLGVDAFMFDYVWKRHDRGMSPAFRDESEVCFIGKGIEKLEKNLSGIWVYDHEYEPSEKEEALRDINTRI